MGSESGMLVNQSHSQGPSVGRLDLLCDGDQPQMGDSDVRSRQPGDWESPGHPGCLTGSSNWSNQNVKKVVKAKHAV